MDNFDSICTGCLACVDTCPEKCISVSNSIDGFYRPLVDSLKCIDCGMCEAFCKSILALSRNIVREVFSCQSKNPEKLIEATSGGVFELLSDAVFEDGGIVFGVAYDDQMSAVHIAATDTVGIRRINGSKYVQSNPLSAYIQVRNMLNSKKLVLFSGVPCQIAGLRTFLGKDYDNLYTVDVPCYGIPSPQFFHDTVDYYEKKHSAKMYSFSFRDKHKNGFSHTSVMKFRKNGKDFTKRIDDYRKIPYHYSFGMRNCFQEKCYDCDYTCMNRVSDITIASFWNIDKITPVYDVKKGVSMVLINSLKGEQLFDSIKPLMIHRKENQTDAISSNSALVKNIEMPLNRKEILLDYSQKGFAYVVKKYYRMSMKSKLGATIPSSFKKLIRTLVLRITKIVFSREG